MKSIFNSIFGVFLFCILLSSTTSRAQTILLNENFDNQFPANGWSVRGYTPTGANWVQYNGGAQSGFFSAAVNPTTNNTNTWLFSSPIQLVAGNIYVLQYYVLAQSSAGLTVSLKKTPDNNSDAIIIRDNFTDLPGLPLVSDTFTAEVSETRYLAFHNNSAGAEYSRTNIDDVKLILLSQLPDCTVPVSATINSSHIIACAGTNITLTLSNSAQNNKNTRHAWQVSEDGQNWSNLSNGYTLVKQLNLTHPGSRFYRHTDTCMLTGTSAVSNIIQIQTTPFQNCICTPVNMNCFNLSISNVTLPGINNNSACSFGGYTNYSNIGVSTVYKNLSIPVQVTVSNSVQVNYSIGLWADFNQNGLFEENEFYSQNNISNSQTVLHFPIPSSAQTGETRLRVKVKYYTNNQAILWTEACSTNSTSGEVEDYRISVNNASVCAGAVSAGNISAPSQICPNTPFTISVTGATANQNQMRYSWQRSVDNVNWESINNSAFIINPFQVSQNKSYYYRLTDTCIASGQFSASSSVLVNSSDIFSCYCVPDNSVCTDYRIDSVSIGSIQNGSNSCSNGGYGNYTSFSTTHSNGSVIPFYVKIKPNLLSTYLWLLVDLNRNGVYENSERLFTGSTQSNPFSGTITIPYSVQAGEYGIRIITNSSGFYTNACTTNGIGEIEDYKLIINQTNPVNKKFTYYVKQNATPGNDGLSWATAFNSLQTALTKCSTGDTVKVAQGTYTPGLTNTQYFSIKDSIMLVGGYPDSGNPGDNDRDITTYKTILSGEIGTTSQTDNIRLILNISGIKGALIDGFIIERGYESSSGNEGPVIISNSSVTISRCVIRNNINGKNGAGMNIRNSALLSVNNIFENNFADGMDSTAAVINAKLGSSISFINGVIAKNKTKYIVNLSNSKMKLYNSTVFKNNGYSIVHDTSELEVRNSIFYYNGGGYITDTSSFFKDAYSKLLLTNSLVENYLGEGQGLNFANPKFKDTSSITGSDNRYFTSDDGLTLVNPCSPAINTGENDYTVDYSFDIKNQPRIKNGIVDLGAYEIQETLTPQPQVVYVNKTATGLNNGTSWQNAFTSLQSAFNTCSDTIKVASGQYPVSVTDEKAYYQLSNNRVIIGGFPNTGSPGNSDWNPKLNPTTIDGTVTGQQKTPTVIVSANNDSTCRFIGFSIINAAPYLYATGLNQASVKITHNSSPYIQNLVMDPSLTYSVNLLTVQAFSNPTFKECTFYNKVTNISSIQESRGLLITSGSNPLFKKCYFGKDTTGNVNGVDGAPLVIKSGAVLLDSCLINRAVNKSISLINGELHATNSIFNKTQGSSIHAVSSDLYIRNCLFTDTIKPVNSSTGVVLLETSSNAIFEKSEFRYSTAFAVNYGSVATVDYSRATFNSCYFNRGNLYHNSELINNKNGEVGVNNSILFMKETDDTGVPLYACAFSVSSGQSLTDVRNSTFIGINISSGGIISAGTGSKIRFYNSIVWGYGSLSPINPMSNDIATEDNNNVSICDIRNSILVKQGGLLTNSITGKDPRLTDITNPAGKDNIMFTSDDGFIPCSCSPAVNSGDNSLSVSSYDINNNNRITNGNIDRGAYELSEQPTDNKVYYVKPGLNSGNGLSWLTAYNNTQQALQNKCADTIKVAKGVYKPAISDRDSSFVINKGVVILGGYPDTGTPSDEDRNPIIYPTVLSGDIGIQNDSLDNTYTVMKVFCPDTTVIIDGIIIADGNKNVSMVNSIGGGGIEAKGNKNFIIRNCVIKKNYAVKGAGLLASASNIIVDKTVIDNNRSANGGAFYLYNYNTLFTNCIISNNKGLGGRVDGDLSPENYFFKNTIFYKNESDIGGGLIVNGPAHVDIVNCGFISNNCLSVSSGIGLTHVSNFFSSGFSTKVFNTVFKNNTMLGQPTSVINNDFNWSNGPNHYETIPLYNLQYSVISNSQTGSGPGNIPSSWVSLKDIDNGPGPDNIWRTTDDGLQVTECSRSIDKGDNSFVNGMETDIMDSLRIRNNKVDMGPYEKETFKTNISATDSLICTGESVTFTASVTGVVNTPVYIWTVNGIPTGTNNPVFTSASLVNNDIVQLKVKNTDCSEFDTAFSNIITIHAGSSLTPTVSISASDTTICAGEQIVFTAAADRANSNTQYQWKVNGSNAGNNSPVFSSSTLADGNTVSVEVVINASCLATQNATSNLLNIHVTSNVTPQITITGSPNPSCQGSPVSFTAATIHPGDNPAYDWLVNGISREQGSPYFNTANLTNNDIVSLKLTSSVSCVTNAVAQSNTVQIQRTEQQNAGVSISAGSMTCPSAGINFSAAIVNGGANPLIQWRKNGVETGISSSSFSSTQLLQNDVIDAIVTSSAACINQATVISNPITVNYTTIVIPTVTITSSQTNICSGTTVVFTANPVDGGSNPVIKWYLNGMFTGVTGNTFSSNTLNNNDVIKARLISSASCVQTPVAESNVINMQVSSTVTPAVTIAANQTTICTGTTVTFTASASNGGTAPSFQWYINNNNTGQTGAVFSSGALQNGDQVKVIMTSNANCLTSPNATSNIITIQVNGTVTPVVTLTADRISICQGNQITFLATPVNGGASPVYQWRVNGSVVGNNNQTYTTGSLNNNDQVMVVMTSNLSCATPLQVNSNIIAVSVTGTVVPTISISGQISVTSGQASSLTSSITNGGASPVYNWQDSTSTHGWQSIPAGNTATYNYIAGATGDKVRCLLTSNENCASPSQVYSNWLQFVVSPVTGINPVNGNNFGIHIYPNPTESIVIVDSLKLVEKWSTYRVVGMNGTKVISETTINNRTSFSIDATKFPAGYYIVIIERKKGGPVFLKFLKQ